MGLPVELQVFAENLYRRFPEEFMALGMPGLEDTFDLRPNGTWSRRILETPSEKTVEITIRRWPPPAFSGPSGPGGSFWGVGACDPFSGNPFRPSGLSAASTYAAQAAVLSQQGLHVPWSSPYGPGFPPDRGPVPPAWPSLGPAAPQQAPVSAWSAPAAASAAPAASRSATPTPTAVLPDDQAGARLKRLETALTSLKPQIEAVLAGQALEQHHRQQSQQQHAQAGVVPASGDHAAGSISQPLSRDASPISAGGSGDLRRRRHVAQLQITTANSSVSRAQPAVSSAVVAPLVVAPNGQNAASTGSGVASASSVVKLDKDGGCRDRSRPKMNISAVRVAPSILDPASPRSPGTFSAWK